MKIWKIGCTTKYGTDTILIKQEKEPTQKELDLIEKKWRKEFDIEKNSEYPYIEINGCIENNIIPTMTQYLQQEDCS